MRYTLYYMSHTFINQIKKMLKKSVLIFILVCALIGGVIGFGAAFIADMAYDDESYIDDTSSYYEDDEYDDEIISDDEELDLGISGMALLELAVGGVVLAMILFNTRSKSAVSVFQPADVTLLFPSPLKPQSVLLFRMLMQILTLVIITIYFTGTLSNIAAEFGAAVVVGMIVAWALTVVYAKLIQVLFFTVSTTHKKTEKFFSNFWLAVVVILAAIFAVVRTSTGLGNFETADYVFNGSFTRYIPIWGWLKAIVMYAAKGNITSAAIFTVISLVCVIALALFVWRLNADFYEEAMAKTEETAALLAAAQEGSSTGIAVKRKASKRNEKIRNSEFSKGSGANVFVYKALYNRKRFARFGFATATLMTYTAVGLAASVLLYFMGGSPATVVPLIIGAMVFYRSLGGEASGDVSTAMFRMIPEKTSKKFFWFLLGDSVICLLDILPALIIAGIASAICVARDGAGLEEALTFGDFAIGALAPFAWLPMIVTLNFFATGTISFLTAALPDNISQQVRSFIGVIFLYFGLVPDIGIIAFGMVLDAEVIAMIASAGFNILLGMLFIWLTAKAFDPKGGLMAAEYYDGNGTGGQGGPGTPYGGQGEPYGGQGTPYGGQGTPYGSPGAYPNNTGGQQNYGVPQTPYGDQNPSGAQQNYGVPQTPYGDQNPSGAQQNYGVPNAGAPYGQPNGYQQGYGPYGPGPGYGGPNLNAQNNILGAKHAFSRIGASLVTYSLVAGIVQIILAFVYDDAIAKTSWGIWVIAMIIPMYVIGLPVCYLIMNNLPTSKFETQNLGVKRFIKAFFICIFLLYAGNFIGIGVNYLITLITGSASESSLDELITGDSYLWTIITVVICAPLAEEFTFRRLIIDRTRKYGEKLAVVMSAFLFGLFHGNLSQFFYAFLLGLVFGYIYIRTGKLRYSVALHGLVNFIGSVLALKVTEITERMGVLDVQEDMLGSIGDIENMLGGASIADYLFVGAYGILIVGGFILGLIFLITSWKKIVFFPAESEFPQKEIRKSSNANAGMIVFYIYCALAIIGTIMMS